MEVGSLLLSEFGASVFAIVALVAVVALIAVASFISFALKIGPRLKGVPLAHNNFIDPLC